MSRHRHSPFRCQNIAVSSNIVDIHTYISDTGVGHFCSRNSEVRWNIWVYVVVVDSHKFIMYIMYTHTNRHIHVHISCIRTHTHTHAHANTHTHTHTHAHTHTNKSIYIYNYIYIQVYIHIYMHIYISTHKYTHVDIYTCTCMYTFKSLHCRRLPAIPFRLFCRYTGLFADIYEPCT